jgi:DNA repair protein RecO (recombination protein O)
MDETYLIKGIVLKRESFRENDHRVIVYSFEKGRLELVTRGSKKITSKLSGHIEPITLGEFMIVKGKLFNYIGAARSENCYPNIKNEIEKVEVVGLAFNFFLKLIKEGQADAENYNLLQDFLEILNNINFRKQFALFLSNIFVFKTIVLFGYQPELYNCVVCKKKIEANNNYFDFSKGGLVCKDCAKNKLTHKDSLLVSNNLIKLLRLIVNEDISFFTEKKIAVDKKTLEEIEMVVKNYMDYII